MAVTVTVLTQTNDYQEWSVIATADADTTTGAITHVMGPNPLVTITNILQAPAGASLWAITALTATAWTGTKSAAAGSGNAGAQIRVRVQRSR